MASNLASNISSSSDSELGEGPPSKKVKFWEQHGTRNKGAAVITCNYCKKDVKSTKGSATSFKNHLMAKHKIAEQPKPSTVPKKSHSTALSQLSMPSTSCETNPTRFEGTGKKRDIRNFLKSTKQQQLKLNKLCSKTVCIDKLPISIFEKPGVKALISKLTGGLTGPSARTVARHLVTAKKRKVKQLKAELQKVRKVNLTLDCWSSRTGSGFLGITAHYVMKSTDGKLTLVHRILEFKRLKVAHTSANILRAIRSSLQKFRILRKVYFIITDSGANIVKALRDGDIMRSSCFAHNLHNVVTNALKLWECRNQADLVSVPHLNDSGSSSESDDNVDTAEQDDFPDLIVGDDDIEETGYTDCSNDDDSSSELNDPDLDSDSESSIPRQRGVSSEVLTLGPALVKIRKLVRILKVSSKSHDLFEAICKTYNLSPSITKDMNVRWNSTLTMIEMYCARKEPLRDFFNQNLRDAKIRELELHSNEWSIMEAVIEVLRPFKQATVIASGYNYVSASKVVLMIKGLLLFCQTPDTSIMAESINGLKELLVVQLRRYFSASPKFDMMLFTRAGFLDPAIYEKMTRVDRESARQSISSLLQQFISEQRSTEELDPIQLNSKSFPIDVAPTKAGTNRKGSPETLDQEDSLFSKFLDTTGLRMNSTRQNANSMSIDRVAANIIRAYEERVPVFLSERRRSGQNNSDPLEFWSDYFYTYPELSEIACIHLSVPATSVPSESAFSIAGYFTRKQCSRMTAKSLELRMFLSDKF